MIRKRVPACITKRESASSSDVRGSNGMLEVCAGEA